VLRIALRRLSDERGGLLATVRQAPVVLDGVHIQFAHRLLASVCYEQALPWDRRAVHRALAGAVSDAEERARHLALAAEGADAGVATELDTASEQAAARGATATAAELFELAAALTPPEGADASRRRRLGAARFHLLAGVGQRATPILRGLVAELPPGAERSDALFLLAMGTSASDFSKGIDLCEQALVEAGSDDFRYSSCST
jgi:hypothetical protein